MIPSDNSAPPSQSVSLVPDPCVVHFYDASRLAGHAVAASIGAPGEIAWDMYLFCDPASTSDIRASAGTLPRPASWFHQLGGARRDWAGSSRYRWSEKLVEALAAGASRRWSAESAPEERHP